MLSGFMASWAKTRLVIIGGCLHAARCVDEILQPVAIPHLRGLGTNSVLQNDNRARFITQYRGRLGRLVVLIDVSIIEHFVQE